MSDDGPRPPLTVRAGRASARRHVGDLFPDDHSRDSGAEPLAADYSTPVAVTEARRTARHAWLTTFLRADDYVGLSGLFPVEPPTSLKTPLVLVHGLLSDPSNLPA